MKMDNWKDATLSVRKEYDYVNPRFRQSVRLDRFPRSQLDVAREAYNTRPTKLTLDEQYEGVAAAQHRKHQEAGTVPASVRAARRRAAAGKIGQQGKPASRDRFESISDSARRAERPRTSVQSGPRAYHASRTPLRTGRSPDVQRLRVATSSPHRNITRQPQAPQVAADAAPQGFFGFVASCFGAARNVFSRMLAGSAQGSGDMPRSWTLVSNFIGWVGRVTGGRQAQ